MPRNWARRRDPRHFRGDIVERLNVLQREGVIADFRLPPRDAPISDEMEIAVRAPADSDPDPALQAARESLCGLPFFEEFGATVVLDQGQL